MDPIALLLCISPLVANAPAPSEVAALPAAAPEASATTTVAPQDDFNEKMKEAGDDPQKLWALYQWTQEDKKREKFAKRALLKLIKVDPEHAEARAALGHTKFEDKWFESERELSAYKKKRAKELGLVEWKGNYVDPADLPYLRKGLEKDKYGRWIDPEIKRKEAEGWVLQDTTWVSPEEKDNVAKGLWKCGAKWLSLDAANEYHAILGDPWVIPQGKAQVHSYADRAVALRALELANKAYYDVTKATGVAPDVPIPFALTRDQEGFLKFCDGDDAFDHPLLEPRALSSQMRAVFADLWFDFKAERYLGMGATFWDPAAEHADNYAIHDVRMAYGLSFMEFVDPASAAIDEALAKKKVDQQFALARLNGRRLPEWIHWGVASYTSRWFVDTSVGQGGNPNWAGQWSADNIRGRGGLDPLGEIMDCQLDAGDDNTSKIVNEVGLLVAFCVDGKNVEVTKKWNAVFEAMRSGGDVESSVNDLRKTLLKCEDDIRVFAKL
ncbi:MAG: hypothetical protein R3F49_18515 [Planctomycetota bacterium]